jgi:hypothetical protein
MTKLKQTSTPKMTSSRRFSASEQHGELDYSGGWRYVNLRIHLAMLRALDHHLSEQQIKGHRMHWIIEAIVEKLEREKSG